MVSSITVSFTGTSTTMLEANFTPEIMLDEDCDYSCALLVLYMKGVEYDDEMAKIDEVRINCDIISESYINSTHTCLLDQFIVTSSNVNNTTFARVPRHLDYYPVLYKNIRSIRISIVDADGKPLKIKNNGIICRIKIKKECN